MTETLLVGSGFSWCSGMYLFDDLNYTETDAEGHLIVTPFYNPAMPLIRYRTNDILEGFRQGELPASKTGIEKNGERLLPFSHMDRVAGRDEDLLWFSRADGSRDFLHPLFLDDLAAAGLLQYQFVQQDEGHFIIRCVTAPGTAPAEMEAEVRAQVDQMLAKKRLSHLVYQIEFPERLYPDAKSGKVPLCVHGSETGSKIT